MSGCIILTKDDITFVPSSGRPSYGSDGINFYKIIIRINNPSDRKNNSYIEFQSKIERKMEDCLKFRDDILGLRQP